MIKIDRNDKGELVGIVLHDEIINNLVIMNCLVGRMYVAGNIVEDTLVAFNVATKAPTFQSNEIMTAPATLRNVIERTSVKRAELEAVPALATSAEPGVS